MAQDSCFLTLPSVQERKEKQRDREVIMNESDYATGGSTVENRAPGTVVLDNRQRLSSLMELLAEVGVIIFLVLSPWLLGTRKAAVR